MTGTPVFDALVHQLGDAERRDLLMRIMQSAPSCVDPLFDPEERHRERRGYEDRYQSLSFFSKLWVMLRSLFTGRQHSDVMKADDIRSIARDISIRNPGMYDPRQKVLMEPFLNELAKLKSAVHPLKAMYEGSIGIDRMAFYALLASFEIPEAHARLVAETDPSLAFERNPMLDDAEVRRQVFASLDEILGSLPEDIRTKAYLDLRATHFLRRITEFPFERFMSFFEIQENGSRQCPVSLVLERMGDLADILYSMAEPPPRALLESIVLFCKRSELGETEKALADTVNAELGKIDDSIAAIRGFNAHVPMGDILRVVKDDPDWGPSELPGGEDWYSMYRSFWKDRIEDQLSAFKAQRDAARLQRQIGEYIGDRPRYVFARGGSGERASFEEIPAIRLEAALSFLYDFDRYVFSAEIQKALKTILLEGEFYKKDNRTEYVESYNELLSIRERIAAFETKLDRGGEYGQAYAQARGEPLTISVKQHRLQAILQSMDDDASQIVRGAVSALQNLVLILGGVLKGGFGEVYDSLSNFSRIGGRANADFVLSVDRAKDRIEGAFHILQNLAAAKAVLAEL